MVFGIWSLLIELSLPNKGGDSFPILPLCWLGCLKRSIFLRDFLTASLGHNPSFTWRSIFRARDLLAEGLVWLVGSGQDIRIWKDKWLPTPTTFALMSPVNTLPEFASVANLICKQDRRWNGPLIDSIFLDYEAKTIKAIPLSLVVHPDKLIWSSTANGQFTVRSTYHLDF